MDTLSREYQRVRKKVYWTLRQHGQIRFCDDITQEIFKMRLEGKSQHQLTEHTVIDILRKWKEIHRPKKKKKAIEVYLNKTVWHRDNFGKLHKVKI